MSVPNNMDALEWLRKRLEDDAGDDCERWIKSFAEHVMAAEADVLGGASYGERSRERVTKQPCRDHPPGHPKLRRGSESWISVPLRPRWANGVAYPLARETRHGLDVPRFPPLIVGGLP